MTNQAPNLNNLDPNAAPAATGALGAGGSNNTLGQVPPPMYPDWLLQTDRGPYFDYTNGYAQKSTSKPSDVTRLFRLRFMFGHDQNGPSWVSPIAYILLVAAQIQIWKVFLGDTVPNRKDGDPFPDMSTFAGYCGATEFIHAQHAGGPHTHGNAIDIEYTRSPYIPMYSGNGYIWDKYSNSYAGFSDQQLQTRIVKACVDIWDKACGGRSPSAPTLALHASENSVLTWIDTMSDFNTKVKSYFAGGANPDDYALVVFATPIGTTTFNPSTEQMSGPSQGKRDPSQGIMGFTRSVAVGILGAKASDLSSLPAFQDSSLQQTLSPYSFEWGPFVFGPDIQHFDIERTNRVYPPDPPPLLHQQAAQAAIEAALAIGSSNQTSNNGPWAPSP